LREILIRKFVGFKFLEALEKHPNELDKLYGIIVEEDEASTFDIDNEYVIWCLQYNF